MESRWIPEQRLLITTISGDLNEDEIKQWEKSLLTALNTIADNEQFKIFINLYGFKALDMNAHKQFRTIVPLTLANYGWKVGYVDMFGEEAQTLIFTNHRGIQCFAAAHCHHDETKMELYESNYSRDNEHFFKNPLEAERWIMEFST